LLIDETTYRFQVTATNFVGVEGPAREYDTLMVTPPLWDDRDVRIDYDQGSLSVKVSAV
jgi:hypothetical protein